MSKVAKYLNEHLVGEVVTDPTVKETFATDASVLTITPEMVIYPRVTNDIRKVARFAWQLAEKGHVLPLTARGNGGDDTGGAIGKGALIVTTVHMNRVFEYDAKQKLVRLQPGVSVDALQEALKLQGAHVPALETDTVSATAGGAVGYAAQGATNEYIHQLEVVLANGDVLQTDRLSKRDLNRKKGLQGLEGDIYRKLDALIDDNKELIDENLFDLKNTVGYARISEVKRKDGSFDLAPLIAGSQGTLGIISEMILKTEFASEHASAAFITFASSADARDAASQLAGLSPSWLDYFDATYFEDALEQGKHYAFYDEAIKEGAVEAVLGMGFEGFNKRGPGKGIKKVAKIASQFNGVVTSAQDGEIEALLTARDVTEFRKITPTSGESAPPLVDGAYVPFERFESFAEEVEKLAKKHHLTLPLHVRPMEGIINTRPTLQLKKVGDKQKIFKLLEEYASLVAASGGYLISESNEGRFKTITAYRQLDDDVKLLFKQIKEIFDPYGILNPGVKQPGDVKQLVAQLRTSYDKVTFAGYIPR